MKYSKIMKRAVYFSDEKIVALKYDMDRNRLVIAGMKNDIENMEFLVYDIFERGRTVTNSSKNFRKARFDFSYPFDVFNQKLKELKKTFHIEEVKSFGRLTR